MIGIAIKLAGKTEIFPSTDFSWWKLNSNSAAISGIKLFQTTNKDLNKYKIDPYINVYDEIYGPNVEGMYDGFFLGKKLVFDLSSQTSFEIIGIGKIISQDHVEISWYDKELNNVYNETRTEVDSGFFLHRNTKPLPVSFCAKSEG